MAVAFVKKSFHSGRTFLCCRLLAGALLMLMASVTSLAHGSQLGVIYPDIREPYRTVFLEIVKGIEQATASEIPKYEIPEDASQSEVVRWARFHELDTVIALGTRGLNASRELPAETRVVIGAVLIEPEPQFNGLTAIALTPDPYVLFERLAELAPHVERVAVVYNANRNAWLIERAALAAQAKGIRLTAFPAQDLHEAASIYKDVLEEGAREGDAIWVLQDPSIIDEGAILASILREAWDKELVVFSSNPVHVRRGALFSLYPDNVGMGRSLARKAASLDRPDFRPSVVPLQDLLIAVNIRTAEHLGLNLTHESRKFDLTFPTR